MQKLVPCATLASNSRGRLYAEPPSATRSPFQRDKDRIIHSGAFRKLRNKTQVFIESEGDYYRTRLTHTIEVAQIARTIARQLEIDEDLTEAVALAHDLGHTCFGHAGEYALDDMMQPYGGFDHNDQAFRILTLLEQRYPAFDGLNLSWETLEGVIKHNGPLSGDLPETIKAYQKIWDLEVGGWCGLEAQVASLADDIAYNTHDMDDGVRAKLITLDQLEGLPLFSDITKIVRKDWPQVGDDRLIYEIVRQAIGVLVKDVLMQTKVNLAVVQPADVQAVRRCGRALVTFSADMQAHIKTIRGFLMENLYRHPRVAATVDQAQAIVKELFNAYMAKPHLMAQDWAIRTSQKQSEALRARLVADYIAGMTDRFALKAYHAAFGKEVKV